MANKDIRIPFKDSARVTLYLDESGVASLRDTKRYYILTGIVAKNSDFHNATSYYINLKRKYFGTSYSIHSSEIFSDYFGREKSTRKKRLFRIQRYKRKFGAELALLIDNLPFIYKTIIIDKHKLINNSKQIRIKSPDQTTIRKAFAIWASHTHNNSFRDFSVSSIKDVIKEIKKEKELNIHNKSPLHMGLREVLIFYFQEYWNNFVTNGNNGEICFESSSDQLEIVKSLIKFKDETDKNGKITQLAKDLRQKIFNVSFPNKYSKFLGLELADLISYGYHLKLQRKLKKTLAYKPIWKVIKDRDKLEISIKIKPLKRI